MSTPVTTPPVVGLGRVPAVAAAPRRQGALLTAAYPGSDETDDSGYPIWQRGVVCWPEATPGWRLVSDIGDPDDYPNYGVGDGIAPCGARPYPVQTLTRCPRTSDLDELRLRARRQLEIATSAAMAREMWTGALAKVSPFNYAGDNVHTLTNPRPDGATGDGGPWLNPHLAAATMLDPEDNPVDAVGAVESAAMALVPGAPVYLHVPPDWLMFLSQFGLRSDGDVITTFLGNIVVADAGYAAALRTDGADVAVYATGPVQAWVSDPIVHDDADQIVELGTNALGVWAERDACHLFDPQTLVGCEVA